MGATLQPLLGRPERLPADVPIADCDVHAPAPSIAALAPWLNDHWREVARTTQFRGPTDTAYPPSAETSLHPRLVAAGEAIETVDDAIRLALDPRGVELAVLASAYSSEAVKNPDAAAVLSRAVNTWLREEWLDREPRLRGSIVVPGLDPVEAARVVDEFGEDERFVQVLLPVRSFAPYGNRLWLPLLEAIARRGLVLALQFGGAPGHPTTSVGWPSTYFEEYADMPSAFQAQLMSLVAEGAFHRHPGLRVLCLESGFAWVPAFMWRFDRLWRGLRREIPWVAQPPSSYLREHVRLATQPFDVPFRRDAFERIVDQMGSERMLCFGSDLPHWQADDADAAIPPIPDGPLLRAIMAGNLRALHDEARAGRES